MLRSGLGEWILMIGMVFGATIPTFGRVHGKRRLVYLTLSAGYQHASVAPSRDIVRKIGEKSGAFETDVAEDVSPFTPENLKQYDAVMFYTTGELPMNEEQKRAFVDFVRTGHGFIGVHSATEAYRSPIAHLMPPRSICWKRGSFHTACSWPRAV